MCSLHLRLERIFIPIYYLFLVALRRFIMRKQPILLIDHGDVIQMMWHFIPYIQHCGIVEMLRSLPECCC